VERARVGLCWDCEHARKVASPKGSTFFLCGRANDDRTYPKYPRLPVVRCSGYDMRQAVEEESESV
jgi:hypothetical protein